MMMASNADGLGGSIGFSPSQRGALNDAWTQFTDNDANAAFAPFEGVGAAGKGKRRKVGLANPLAPTDAAPSSEVNFADALKNSLKEVNQLQNKAQQNVQDFAVGKEIPLHQVMISLTEAEQSLQLATQVRNKLIAAYQDIKNMQI